MPQVNPMAESPQLALLEVFQPPPSEQRWNKDSLPL